MIKRVKKTVPWACFINDLDGEQIAGKFHEKELQKKIKKSLQLEK